jgi:SAM-dependent methyltransferase
MSFQAVDASPRGGALVEYLNAAASNLEGLKSRISDHLQVSTRDRLLDLGCGTGHDVEHLRQQGCLAVGLDPSKVMIDASAARLRGPDDLVQASGFALPFRDGSFDGCRIERVLQHVSCPSAILDEVRRIVRPGGGIAVMEPDWATLALHSRLPEISLAMTEAMCAGPPQPLVGRQLVALLVETGFDTVEVEIDAPAWRDYETARRILRLPNLIERAKRLGLTTDDQTRTWIADLQDLSANGCFFGSVSRVIAWRAITPA